MIETRMNFKWFDLRREEKDEIVQIEKFSEIVESVCITE